MAMAAPAMRMVALLLMAMGSFWPLLGTSAATAAASDKAFLIAHKKADLKRSKGGSERITVSIDLHNVGATTAYDISLNDDTWPTEFFKLSIGNISASWDKLEVGGSLSHTFVLESKVKTVFNGPPAVVKYRVAAKSALQEALSTPLLELDVLSDKAAELKLDWKLAVKYGPLAAVLTIVGLFVYLLVSPAKSKQYLKAAKKRR
ncbi:hypothetical protein O6H91_03G069600 [Diphasiastrum complanatum]|uniref:Uncharacterized protein n=1 Tax=Diphasiastrum complanatum TaxID=34168 RepID=A0ACC2E7B2_DIPCM|nr:hypothetical protein O6H91_03G069600 [Diphasiastrum complanatum]